MKLTPRRYCNILKRKTLKAITLAVIAAAHIACSAPKEHLQNQGNSAQQTIAFTTGKNYFIKNSIDVAMLPNVVTSKQEFDSIFGTAAVMGKNGQPTAIDFSNQSVVCIAMPPTDRPTDITPLSISPISQDSIEVSYKVTRQGPTTYTMLPFAMLIVSKKDIDAKNIILKETTN